VHVVIESKISPLDLRDGYTLNVMVTSYGAHVAVVDGGDDVLAEALVDADHLLHAVKGPDYFFCVLHPVDEERTPNHVSVEVVGGETTVEIFDAVDDPHSTFTATVAADDLEHALLSPQGWICDDCHSGEHRDDSSPLDAEFQELLRQSPPF
jgi:hypothetical protein